MSNPNPPKPRVPREAETVEDIPARSGEQFDGGTDADEDAGAGFGEGDDARRGRGEQGPD